MKSSSSSSPSKLTIIVSAILSLIVSTTSGVIVFRINDKKTDLNYNVISSATFSGQTQNTAIVAVVVNNSSEKELEKIRIIIPLGNAKLIEPKIIGLQFGSYSQNINPKQVEINVPYLNPKESFSIQLLLTLSYPSWSVNNSSISVRGKGITATLASSVDKNKDFLGILSSFVVGVLSVFIYISTYFFSASKIDKHNDDQRDIVAYILGVYGFYKEASQLRNLQREITYWSIADSVAEQCLQSGDPATVQRGIDCLSSLLSYAYIHEDSELLIKYNLARLAATTTDLKLARDYLEEARKGNNSVINMRINFDKSLSKII
ncbi:hypothetical protein [Nostoc sp. DedQUE07]|uniref:hypothetical protein n=1 Tax=Nostoc sp. DedQUE07 TaxID=3075392 RepID=UPI002AD506E5|nr:hypothetical protein [Nostoc sp. DedQUE07]MDZ8131487.1 hypothetical protein [Nostoc sp. DedQUE07]